MKDVRLGSVFVLIVTMMALSGDVVFFGGSPCG